MAKATSFPVSVTLATDSMAPDPARPFAIRTATAADNAVWARLRFALWPESPAHRHAVERESNLRLPGTVDRPWRRQGVGRALIDFVAAWARRQGFRELASDVEWENHPSQHAHQNLGVIETERTVNYLLKLET